MARNQEKAKSVLFKWHEMQRMERGLASSKTFRKPKPNSFANSIAEAEQWRTSLVSEITHKVSLICTCTVVKDEDQHKTRRGNALTVEQVRDLNDEINRLQREQLKWENKLRELGGTDYRKNALKYLDDEGKELEGSPGYKYFGKARELPGVKELFEQQINALKFVKRSRFELTKLVDAEYYGLLEDSNAELLAAEEHYETETGRMAIPKGFFDSVEAVHVPSIQEIEKYVEERLKRDQAQRYL